MAQYWMTQSKEMVIKLIVESGLWNGTKTQLKFMKLKQLQAILHKFRQTQLNILIKKESVETLQNPQQTQEV